MTALAIALRESSRWSATIRSYVAITKPRIILLLLATTVPAMVVAEGGWPSTALVIATLIGGTASAAGANAVNCWYDRDIDALMRRTQSAPARCGAISRRSTPSSSGSRSAWAPSPSFGRRRTCWRRRWQGRPFLFYVFIYTVWLKRRSSQNIVIRGAAGAFPPMVGWAAVTGDLAWAPVVMFAIVFFWDTTALLGAGLRHRPRLPRGRRAHASRGKQARSRTRRQILPLLARARADHAVAGAYGRRGLGLRGGGRRGGAGVCGRSRSRCGAGPERVPSMRLYTYSLAYLCGDLYGYGPWTLPYSGNLRSTFQHGTHSRTSHNEEQSPMKRLQPWIITAFAAALTLSVIAGVSAQGSPSTPPLAFKRDDHGPRGRSGRRPQC